MEEKFVLKGQDLSIPCKLTQPDWGSIRRIVLGVHGFGGSTDDTIQTAISEEMDLFYAATVRFDFPAHGQSPHTGDDLTVGNCITSLLTVARYARQRFPDVEDLCIFATGFGAYITLLSLQELLEMPGKIRLVIQTPALLMHKTLLSMMRISAQTLWAMERYTIKAPRPFDVTYSFYEELQRHIALASYPIPMLILRAEEDSFVPMSDVQNFSRINEQSKLVVIPGTSHQFRESGAWDMVLDLTRDWFEYEQVLLSDWS